MRLFLMILLSIFMTLVGGCFDKQLPNSTINHIRQSEHAQHLKGIQGPENPSYKMKVQYDSTSHEITGTMRVKFTNNLHDPLTEVYFNLWPKADDFAEGDMSVSHVKYNGEKIDTNIDQIHLHVSGFSLPKNRSAEISMSFTVQIPEQRHRFGWYGTSVSLGNWFPILAVYDDNGWNLHPYFEEGESFYSLTGDYEVALTTDDDIIVATTGKKVSEENTGYKQITQHFKAQSVRDFALQMDTDYDVEIIDVGHMKMNIYYTKEHEEFGQKDLLIQSGIESLQLFNDKIGPYAWDELNIVGMKCGFGGMEYPQLIMICLDNSHSLEYVKSVVAHEIGHQWFYAAVGNNQYREPWLDESFASFLEVLSMGALNQLAHDELQEPKYPYYLNAPVSTFSQHGEAGNEAYWKYIYDYGLQTLNDLRLELGDDAFYQAMQQYYDEMKFGIATTTDFIRIIEESTGRDLVDFLGDHFIQIDEYNQ